MADINELRINIESLNRSTTTDLKKQSYTLVQKSLEGLDAEFTSLRKDLSLKTEALEQVKKENLTLKMEHDLLSDRLTQIVKEKAEVENKLELLSRSRPELSSANLVRAFRDSFEQMDENLNSGSSRANYQVSSMNIRLKTNLSMQDNELRFQLPKASDIIPADNMSEIEFSIVSSHKEPSFAGYSQVPDVVGLHRDVALSVIKDAGFASGEIIEKESDLAQGTVISQVPSGVSLAKPGEPVDLFISQITSVKVPQITGMMQEGAKKVLVASKLNAGKITEQADASTPGTVLSQSVASGAVVDVGTAIDFIVSVSVNEVLETVTTEKAPSTPSSIFVDINRSKTAAANTATRLSNISTISRKDV